MACPPCAPPHGFREAGGTHRLGSGGGGVGGGQCPVRASTGAGEVVRPDGVIGTVNGVPGGEVPEHPAAFHPGRDRLEKVVIRPDGIVGPVGETVAVGAPGFCDVSWAAGSSCDLRLNSCGCISILVFSLPHQLRRGGARIFARPSHHLSTADRESQQSVALVAIRAPQHSATMPASPKMRQTQHLTTLRGPRHDMW